jgi:DNA-binding MarR family transcriptional regulator
VLLRVLHRIDHAVHRELERVVSDAGYPEVRARHIMLLSLIGSDDGVRMSALAEQMQLTQGAVTQLVAHLESVGVVERAKDQVDGRGVVVRSLPASRGGWAACRGRLAEFEEEWERLVGAERWATFKEVAMEIDHHLSENPE